MAKRERLKGVSDEMLGWQTERSLALESARREWADQVRPEQSSTSHSTDCNVGRGTPGGVALRFARVLRYRDDKSAAEADTIETVLALAGR